MAHLSISCLGPFRATVDGRPLTGFKSNKVRALLVYLAVEADRPHRREVLASLLWPEWPDREALSYLRHALSNLRRVIGDQTAEPPHLLIARDSLQFNSASDCRLDVKEFAALSEPAQATSGSLQDLSALEEAVALYSGAFLEGFTIKDSLPFEEWALLKRQQLSQQLLLDLRYLSTSYEQQGQHRQAVASARRQIELEPWDEVAHQQLMRNLALGGQRSAALAQYESCCRLLAEELDVEPAQETTRLYEQIRDGSLTASQPLTAIAPETVVEAPAFLDEKVAVDVARAIFVAREDELAQLDRHLKAALAGRGRVAFVTGEAGSGKTALIQEFARRAQETHAASKGLLVAGGNCNAYTGIGDPYLPFREILELLSGDVEAKWAAGAISREHARRLWSALPAAARALVEVGPDLVDTFVMGAALRERARAFGEWPGKSAWSARMDALAERLPVKGSGGLGHQQRDLFEQYAKVLQALALRGPLLLVLDDLQWADLGSISLLFHLGRHLAGCPILILGAYRAEEVALGRDGERHPLEPVVNEFQQLFGDPSVNVDRAEHRDFVASLLDSESNGLGNSFREMLYRQTGGHPLFTTELLRGLQERGDLVRNAEGRWLEGPSLDWETLPARVEAAIAERIGRLARPLRDALRVASVEGEVFTAEVVARVQGADEREIVRGLSSELDRRHHLVRAQAIRRTGARRISRYRFRNYLFQKYLYDSLDPVERAYLHEDVGNALQELYGDGTAELKAAAPQLAWHFQEAGITGKAIHYLHQAGERAVQLTAFQEGITHLSKGLNLLLALPKSTERAQQEFILQMALGIAWQGFKGARSSEVREAHTRARELSRQTGQSAQLSRVLGEMAVFHYVGAEYDTALELAEEALSLAQEADDAILAALSRWYVAFVSFCMGDHETARSHFEQVISFYEPEAHHEALVVLAGKDAGLGARAYDACCLWCLGHPEQAMNRSQEAISMARALDHPFALADTLCFAGCQLNEMARNAKGLKEYANEIIRLADESVPGWSGTGNCFLGEALAMIGQLQEGIEQMEKGLKMERAIGVRCYWSGRHGFLAEAQLRAGRVEEASEILARALDHVERTGERYWEPELNRLQAEIQLVQGNESGAEAALLQAVDVARRQKARMLELRSAVGLARLWRRQGKTAEARELLEPIYGWFTEGFDTPDLREARALLDELA